MTGLPSQRDDSKSSDPLANVERLLDEVLDCAEDPDMYGPTKTPAEAREAVRLLLMEARAVAGSRQCPTSVQSAADALHAFARSLDGEPS